MIENRSGFSVCVRTGRETAGPSTALRSGRDDDSVGPLALIHLTAFRPFPCNRIVIPPCPGLPWNRSEAQWRDLLFLFLFSRGLYQRLSLISRVKPTVLI